MPITTILFRQPEAKNRDRRSVEGMLHQIRA